MSPVASAAVSVRRLLVRRPWIYWSVAALAALGAAADLHVRADRIDAERATWGATRQVWVATADHAPGDPLAVARREMPVAVLAVSAATSDRDVAGLVARQEIAAGEVVHLVDLVAPGGPTAMVPTGWRAVPVVESPPSGARPGDRVEVVGDGFVMSSEAIVVGHHDQSTLVAVPADTAPALSVDTVTLLLRP